LREWSGWEKNSPELGPGVSFTELVRRERKPEKIGRGGEPMVQEKEIHRR